MPEEGNEIQRIHIVKRAVLEMEQFFEVGFAVVNYKIIRGTIHQGDQLVAFIDDGYALPPGQHRGPKAHDLDILRFAETVLDRNRVVLYKLRPVVLIHLAVQKS